MVYIVRICEGCWLAPWSGDPGRTLVKENAKTYETEWAARCAIHQEKRRNPHRNFNKATVENKQK